MSSSVGDFTTEKRRKREISWQSLSTLPRTDRRQIRTIACDLKRPPTAFLESYGRRSCAYIWGATNAFGSAPANAYRDEFAARQPAAQRASTYLLKATLVTAIYFFPSFSDTVPVTVPCLPVWQMAS